MTKLTKAQRVRLAELADNWVEDTMNDLSQGNYDLGAWSDDAKIPIELQDEAYSYMMARFRKWNGHVAITRILMTP